MEEVVVVAIFVAMISFLELIAERLSGEQRDESWKGGMQMAYQIF
jgi:hypothetical protein